MIVRDGIPRDRLAAVGTAVVIMPRPAAAESWCARLQPPEALATHRIRMLRASHPFRPAAAIAAL